MCLALDLLGKPQQPHKVSQSHAKWRRKKLRPRSYTGVLLLEFRFGPQAHPRSFLSAPLCHSEGRITIQSLAKKSVSCGKVLTVLPACDKSNRVCIWPVTIDQISITPPPNLHHFQTRYFSSEQQCHTLQNQGVRTGHVIGARYELTKMTVGGFGCRNLSHFSMTAPNEPHDEAICLPRRWQGTFRKSSMACSLFIFLGGTCQSQVFRVLRKHT